MNLLSEIGINAGVFLSITIGGMVSVMIAASTILNSALKQVSDLRDKTESDRLKIAELERRISALEPDPDSIESYKQGSASKGPVPKQADIPKG